MDHAEEFLDELDEAGKIHLHEGNGMWYTVTAPTRKCTTEGCAIIFFEEFIKRGDADDRSEAGPQSDAVRTSDVA